MSVALRLIPEDEENPEDKSGKELKKLRSRLENLDTSDEGVGFIRENFREQIKSSEKKLLIFWSVN